jgi:single-strand DNA-binding protein
VANLRVAVTQRIQQDGQWRDGDTSFLKVNVWRGQDEHLADSLAKGDRVMVTGRLRQRSWETPEGDKRSVTEIEPTRSAPPSSGPPPRSNAPASAATATAPRVGSGRPNAAGTSPTRRPSDQQFDPVRAPGFGRGHRFARRAGSWSSSFNLAFKAPPWGPEVLLVDADTYGGSVAHTTIQEHHR